LYRLGLKMLSRFLLAVCFINTAYSSTESISCAVIGGGIGGLTFAYYAREQSPTLQVFEASTRLGGRIETNKTVSNRPIEFGAEIIDNYQHEIQNLAKKLGVRLSKRSVLDTIRGFDQDKSYTAKDFDTWIKEAETFIENFLKKNDATVQKIWLPLKPFSKNDLKNPTYQMLQAIVRDENGKDLEDLDLFGWKGLQTILAERKKMAKVDRFCPAFGLQCYQKLSPIQYRIDGGSEVIIDALAKNIALNNIKMQHALKSLKKLENGLYQLTFTMSDGKDKVVEAEKVIMGIPFSAWKKSQA
jgi:protoporphyrinogen oxidase